MSTICSAIHGFLSGRNNFVGRMHGVSLGILIYLIWEERNNRVFDNSYTPVSLFFFVDSRFSSTWFCIFMNRLSFRVVVVLFVGAVSVLSLLVMVFLEWGCSVGLMLSIF